MPKIDETHPAVEAAWRPLPSHVSKTRVADALNAALPHLTPADVPHVLEELAQRAERDAAISQETYRGGEEMYHPDLLENIAAWLRAQAEPGGWEE